MKSLSLILCILTSPSCGLFEGEPTFERPSKKSVAGTYLVEDVSWFVPDRRELKTVLLTLSDSGRYQLRAHDDQLSSPLIPCSSGLWEITPRRGMDLGSRETWGVRFISPNGNRTEAYLLNQMPPYRMMFVDYSRRSQVGEVLILKKSEQGVRGKADPAIR